jgi:pimeloyl-ACP methyl ester carboxylesterase
MPGENKPYYSFHAGDDSRPAIVLLHGAGGTHLYWPPEIRRLAGYQVYALDLPGHGRSTGESAGTIQAYAGEIHGWMQSLGLGQGVVVGHSMGSAIALTLALEFQPSVLALILIGAGARLRVHPIILESCASEATFRSAVGIVNEWAFSEQAPPRLVELAARRMAETPQKVLYGDFLACNEFDVMDRLGEIRQKTLVLAGAEDRLSPERYARYLAEGIPGAKLEIIPGAGHMLMLEQPGLVAERIRSFLDQL